MDFNPKNLPGHNLTSQSPSRHVPDLTTTLVPNMLVPGEEAGVFAHHWTVLRKHIFLIVAMTLGCALLGFLISLPRTPMYQGRAKLEVQGLNENYLNLHQFSQTASGGGSATLADTYLQTQIEVLQTDSLLERVIEKLNLRRSAEFAGPHSFDKVLEWFGFGYQPQNKSVASLLPVVARNLKIRPTRQTAIVELSYDSADPQTAAAFVNTLIDEYMDQDVNFRWEQTKRTRDWLAQQLADAKRALERSENELLNYSRSQGLLYTAETNNVAEEKLRQLQAELSRVQAERMNHESLYKMTTSHTAETLPAVLDNGPLREYQVRLADLRRQRADLNSTLTPNNSRVLRLDAQISDLEGTMKREQMFIVDRIKNEYEAAQERERLLGTAYSKQVGLISQQGNKAIRYNTLRREVDSSRSIYEAMLQKVKDAGLASAVQASSVRVVDRARPPETAYKPQKTLSAGLGLLAGLIFSLTFVAVREGTNQTIESPGLARSFLNVPQLGAVPSMNLVRPASSGKGERRHISGSLFNGTGEFSSEIVLDTRRRELAALTQSPVMMDSFRAIITSILFSAHNAPKVIVVSSPRSGDGKTTMVCNLGIVLSKIGHRVLVIDADPRRPNLHQIFRVHRAAGLSEWLNEPQIRGDLSQVVKTTGIPRLSVLPSGMENDDFGTALFSPQTAALLSLAKREFDTILIDTPPMLPTPEARILGRVADAVVLVLRAHKTTKEDALICTHRLAEDRTRLLGTILNDWKAEPSSYAYYSSSAAKSGKAS